MPRTIKKIVLGLGNPGAEYENTYHNAGVLAVKAIGDESEAASAAEWKIHKKGGREIFLYKYGAGAAAATEELTAFVIPLVFMNQSGMAAGEALKYFGASTDNLFVVHDDSDLPIGTVKTAKGRGAAGHKGVESIIKSIGTNEFTRIRVGIRNPDEKRRKKAGEFVLKKISEKDGEALLAAFRNITI